MNQDLPEAPRITLHQSEMHVVPPQPEGDKELNVEDLRCQWCSGFHVTNCWAIQEVEFFPDGRWAKIKLSPRPQAEANTVYDFEEIQDALVPQPED